MLSMSEVLGKAKKFRQEALEVHKEYKQLLKRPGVIKVLEKDLGKVIKEAKTGKITLVGIDGVLEILKLKKRLLELQSLFYQFSEFIEPMDLLPDLEQEEYRYIMTKARENNQDISSACHIGNIMFAATVRDVVADNTKWNLMLYRIKRNWRKKYIKLVV